MIRRDDWGAGLDIIRGQGSCTPIIWPGMGASARSIHLFVFGPGSRTIRMRHPSEAAYYVLEGEAQVVDHNTGSYWPLVAGSMFHIDPATTYGIEAGPAGARILGGPCPPDPALYQPGLTDAEPGRR